MIHSAASPRGSVELVNTRRISTPFAEFQWAEYFRNYITLAALRTYPERALECARKLVREGSSTCGAKLGGVLEHSSAERCPGVRNGVRLCDERHTAQ